MNEKELNSNNSADNMPESNSAEFISRAEKIKAIKNSIKNRENIQESIPNQSESIPETPQTVTESTDSDWESEIAERIAKRVKKLKSNKNDELLAMLEGTKKTSEPLEKEKIQYVPKHEALPENYDVQPEPESFEPNSDTSQNYCNEEYVSDMQYDEPDESYENQEESIVSQEMQDTSEDKPKKKKKKRKKKSFKESFLGFFPQKKDSVFEKCRKVVFLTSIVAIAVCGTIVLEYYIDTSTAQHEYEDIMNEYGGKYVPSQTTTSDENVEQSEIQYLMMPNAEELCKINPDVIGVINIPGTEVFYPVLKGEDNNEYLNKTITGEEARAGSIFMDYRNTFDEVKDGKMQQNSDNIILYGHEMATGKMFGQLKEYKDNTYFYEEHPIIEFNSNYFCYQYKIFSIMIVDADDKTDTKYEYWNKLSFDDEKDFYNFVNEAKRRTFRLNDVDVKYGDEILTLSTCNGIFGKDAGGRLVVMARRVREGEDLYEGTKNSSANPNIKWPTIYYNYNSNEKYDEKDFVPYG